MTGVVLAWLAAAGLLAAPADRLVAIDTRALPIEVATGGLSGIDRNAKTGEWLAISDDRSEHAPARLVRLAIGYDAAGFNEAQANGTVALRDREGIAYVRKQVDAEAVRFGPDGRIYWSSERDQTAVRVADAGGNTLRELYLPPAFAKARNNAAIEGLSFAPGGSLWLAHEAPLAGEGELPTTTAGALVRLTRVSVRGRVRAEYRYPVDALPAHFAGRQADNGIAEVIALDRKHLLVLERSGAPRIDGSGYDFDTRLYCARLSRVVTKTLVATLPPAVGNVEGMAFGPPLPDGRQALVLVNDNNFVAGEPTRLLLYATRRPVRRAALAGELCGRKRPGPTP